MTAGPQDTPPTARDRLAVEQMAERLCQAAFHVRCCDENVSWQALWMRVAEEALKAREEVLAPFVALAEELDGFTVNRNPAPGSYDAGVVAAFVNAAARIRRAVEEAQTNPADELVRETEAMGLYGDEEGQ